MKEAKKMQADSVRVLLKDYGNKKISVIQVVKEELGLGLKETKDLVEEWKAGNPQKPLLLVGPAGIGKTTLAHAIAREFSEFVELNASDKRSEDIIMSTVGESSSTRSLFGDNYKVIILDEVDGIHGTNDRGGVRAIGKIIENAKHPLIMNANDFYSKRLTSIKPKCQVINR